VGLEAYTDPGATLVNDPQPDLLVTSHLFLGGETRFRTITRSQVLIPRERPTPPDRPWLVRYSVREEDAWPWRDSATPLIREIIVVCPEGERVCTAEGSEGSSFCSTEGFCIEFTDAAESDFNAERFPPKITLKSSGTGTRVDARSVYEICSLERSTHEASCEPGVEATDTIRTASGERTFSISSLVKMRCQFTSAISNEDSPLGPLVDFSDGLQECGFSTAQPGRWVIYFEVTNSAGFTSRVEKEVQIIGVCQPGEILCSVGVCVQSDDQCTLFGNNAGSNNVDTSAADGSTPRPWLGLRAVPGREDGGDSILIPEGHEYKACSEDGAEEPCEPGADARDETGDIANRVWACPQSPLMPANCQANPGACPFEEYGFHVAGLKFCKLSPSGGQDEFQNGDSFEIQFVAMANSGRTSTKSRFVTVGKRCPNDAQPHWCNAPALGKPTFRCVALECEQWQAIGAPDGPGENSTPGFGTASSQDEEINDATNVSNPDKDSTPDVPNAPQGSNSGSTRRLRRRNLLQDTGDGAGGTGSRTAAPTTITRKVNLAYGFAARTTPEGVIWRNSPLAPCQPESDADAVCGTAAIDAKGRSIRVSTSTPCTDAFKSLDDFGDFVDAVNRTTVFDHGDVCQSNTCSPSAADRGQCMPGRYIVRYVAVDSQKRESALNLVARIENGARHRVQILGSVACVDGPQALDAELNSGRPVLKGLPYLKALGLDFDSTRLVRLVGDSVRIGQVIHPGTESMPQLCQAVFVLEVQVGCTPEVAGFKTGPSLDETEEQWCPCTVDWDPTYQGNPFEIDTQREYPVAADQDGRPTYGPLISYSLQSPEGAALNGPSPFCSAVTRAIDSPEARIQQGGAAISSIEDASNSLLAFIERLSQSVENILDNQHNKTDAKIEKQWRQLLSGFAEVQSDRMDEMRQLELVLRALDAAATAGSELVDRSPVSLSGGLLASGVDLSASMVNTQEIGREPLRVAVDPDSISTSTEECVDRKRGGTDTNFFFTVGGDAETYAPQDGVAQGNPIETAFAAAGLRPVWSRRLLESNVWMGYPLQDAAAQHGDPMLGPSTPFGMIDRTIGIRGNQVLAGSLFVQERREPSSLLPGGQRYNSVCKGGGLAPDLAAECRPSRLQAAREMLTFQEARQHKDPSKPIWIGVDPGFVSTSSLFNPSLAADGWYNTTDGSPEVNRFGVPHGFQSAPPGLEGMPDTSEPLYPIMLDISAGNQETRRVLTFMKEGNFFSRMATSRVKFKIASLALELQLFGYLVVDAQWDDAGLVQAFFKIQALENKDYTSSGLQMEGMRNRLVNDMVLVAFVLMYNLLTAVDIAKSIRAKRRRQHLWQELIRSSTLRHSGLLLHRQSSDTLLRGAEALRSTFRGCKADTLDELEPSGHAMQIDWLPEYEFDDSQVNEHPIAKDERRTVKLTHSLSPPRKREDNIGDLDLMSETSDSPLGLHFRHGAKRLILQPVNRVYRGSINTFWMAYELIICLFLLLGLGLMLYYAFSLHPEEAPTERRIPVYDALGAPARPFMLTRSVHESGEAQLEANSNGTSTGMSNSDLVPSDSLPDLAQAPSFIIRAPGQPGRWKMGEEDTAGLKRAARMFKMLELMATIKTGYTLVFAAAMVLLLVRLLVQASFQPRLSLIAGTLMLGMADILYFISVLVVVGAMLAVALNVSFGNRSSELAALSGAMLSVFQGVMLGGDQATDIESVLAPFLRTEATSVLDLGARFAYDTNIAAMGLASIFMSIRPLIFIFMFVIVMSILAKPFAMLKAGSRNAPGVPQDIATIARWIWKIIVKNQPNNKAVERYVQGALRQGPSAEMIHANQCFPDSPKRSSSEGTASSSTQDDAQHSLEARTSGPKVDWSELHALLHGGHAPAPTDSRENHDSNGTLRALPDKGAQFKMWLHDLRQSTKRRNTVAPDEGSVHAAEDVESGAALHPVNIVSDPVKVPLDVESGQDVELNSSSSSGHQTAQAFKASSATCLSVLTEAPGSAAGSFHGIDFQAAKEQITALLASQHTQDKDLALKTFQRMNMLLEATTASSSVKTTLQPTKRKRREADWLDKQAVHVQDLAGSMAAQLMRGVSRRMGMLKHSTSIAVADAGVDADAASGAAPDGDTDADAASIDQAPSPATQVPLQDGANAGTDTSNSTFAAQTNNTAPKVDLLHLSPISSLFGAPAIPPLSLSPPSREVWMLVQGLVRLTLENAALLRQVQAACLDCEQAVYSVQSLLRDT